MEAIDERRAPNNRATEESRNTRELHDALSQTLFAAAVMVGTLARTAEGESADAVAAIRRQARTLQTLVRGAIAQMRMMLFELHPAILEQVSMAELLQLAVESLASRGDVDVELQLARSDALPVSTRMQLYRIAQEALSNVARHSGADRVVVAWEAAAHDRRVFRIADNGCGMDLKTPLFTSPGLDRMRARAAQIGAAFSVRSSPGRGTELRVQLG